MQHYRIVALGSFAEDLCRRMGRVAASKPFMNKCPLMQFEHVKFG